MNPTKYDPGNKLVNAYAPATEEVAAPTTLDAASNSRTTTFASPGSPPSCWPLPFASTHVKSPSEAGRTKPASTVASAWPLTSATSAVRFVPASGSLSVASAPTFAVVNR